MATVSSSSLIRDSSVVESDEETAERKIRVLISRKRFADWFEEVYIDLVDLIVS